MGRRERARRRSIVAVPIAVALIAVALIGVTQRPALLGTVAVRPALGLARIVVDERVGQAYVTSDDGGGHPSHVRVLDTTRGALLRTIALPATVGGLVVDARRGRVYAARSGPARCSSARSGLQTCAPTGSGIDVLDAQTGRLLRVLPVDAGDALALDDRTGLLYAVPSGGGTSPNGLATGASIVRAIDPSTGRTVWTVRLSGGKQVFGFVTLGVDGHEGRLIAARTSLTTGGLSGAPIWSDTIDVVDLRGERLLLHIPLAAGSFGADRPPLIDAGRARAFVAVSGSGTGLMRIVALDIRRGAILHTTTMGGSLGGIAEDARTGRIFTTTQGAARWVPTRTGNNASTTSVPAGMGSLLMFDAWGGTLLRVLPIGLGTTDVAVDEQRGRVYVLSVGAADAHNGLTRPGTLSVVDEQSGQVVRTLTVGAVPTSLTLDRHADRLLVGCVGTIGGGPPNDPWGWVPPSLRHLLPFIPRPPTPSYPPPGSIMIFDTTRL